MSFSLIDITSNSSEEQINLLIEQNLHNSQIKVSFEVLLGCEQKFASIISENLKRFDNLVDLSLTVQCYCILENTAYSIIGNDKLQVNIGEFCQIGSDGITSLSSGIKQISNLSELEIILKCGNMIGIESLNSVGDCISNLKNLKNLSIEIGIQNQLCSQGIQILCSSIKQIELLISLSLKIDFQRFDKDSLISFSETLTYLKNLQNFNINISSEMCQIEEIKNLFSAQAQLKQLKALSFNMLDLQFLNNDQTEQFTNCLSQLINLESLKIQELVTNYKTQNEVFVFQPLNYIKNLKHLQLSLYKAKNIKNEESLMLFNSLSKHNQLEFLKLTIHDRDAQQIGLVDRISDSLQHFKCLKSLELNFFFSLRPKYFERIFESFKYLDQLEYLQFQLYEKSNVSMKCIKNIGDGLKFLSKLKSMTLFIPQDSLQTDQLLIFLSSFKYLKSLTNLRLQILDQFSNQAIQQLGEELQNLHQLQELIIYIQFEQSIVSFQEFKVAFLNFKQLESLNLTFNGSYYDNQDQMIKLFQGLKEMKMLKQLSLNFNFEFNQDISQVLGESLSNLQNLEKLELSGLCCRFNHFSLVIQFLGKIKLRKLQIIINQLNDTIEDDDDYQQLINNFNDLQHLNELQLMIYSYNIKIDIYQIFSKCIQNLKQLTMLDFNFMGYTNEIRGLYALKDSFQNLSNLLQLQFSLNILDKNMREVYIKYLIDGLSCLRKLRYLEINLNTCKEDIIQLSHSFSRLENLSQLRININTLSCFEYDENVKSQILNEQIQNELDSNQDNKISDKIGFPKKLAELIININKQIDSYSQDFSDIFKNFSNSQYLSNLSLSIIESFSNINEYFSLFSHSLLNIKYLQNLNISLMNNNLNCQSLMSFGKGITQLVNLEQFKLSLESNQISQDGLANIIESLRYLKNVNILDLELFLNMDDSVITKIGESIQYLSSLEYLSIQTDKQTIQSDKGIQSIGQGLSHLKNLKKLSLNLGQNQIIGDKDISCLAFGLSQQKYLKKLDLNVRGNSCITNQGYSDLANSLQKLYNLVEISISVSKGNGIKQDSIKLFVKAFIQQINLKYVFLEVSLEDGLLDDLKIIGKFFLPQRKQCNLKICDNEYVENTWIQIQNDVYDFGFKFEYKNKLENYNFQNLLSIFDELPLEVKPKILIETQKNNQNQYKQLFQNLDNLKQTELNIHTIGTLDECLIDISNALVQMKNLQCLNIQLEQLQVSSKEKVIQFTNSLLKLQKLQCLKFHIDESTYLDLNSHNAILCQLSSIKSLRQFIFKAYNFIDESQRLKLFSLLIKQNKKMIELKMLSYYDSF